MPRLETGIVQGDGDWPGVFIRGDGAKMRYARALRAVLNGKASAIQTAQVENLLRLLQSVDESDEGQRQRVTVDAAPPAPATDTHAPLEALAAMDDATQDVVREVMRIPALTWDECDTPKRVQAFSETLFGGYTVCQSGLSEIGFWVMCPGGRRRKAESFEAGKALAQEDFERAALSFLKGGTSFENLPADASAILAFLKKPA